LSAPGGGKSRVCRASVSDHRRVRKSSIESIPGSINLVGRWKRVMNHKPSMAGWAESEGGRGASRWRRQGGEGRGDHRTSTHVGDLASTEILFGTEQPVGAVLRGRNHHARGLAGPAEVFRGAGFERRSINGGCPDDRESADARTALFAGKLSAVLFRNQAGPAMLGVGGAAGAGWWRANW